MYLFCAWERYEYCATIQSWFQGSAYGIQLRLLVRAETRWVNFSSERSAPLRCAWPSIAAHTWIIKAKQFERHADLMRLFLLFLLVRVNRSVFDTLVSACGWADYGKHYADIDVTYHASLKLFWGFSWGSENMKCPRISSKKLQTCA